MLKVIGKLDPEDSSLTVDEYVPVSFRCPSVSSVPSVWWRTGNLKTSLLEIGISNSIKAIYDVTAVILPEVSIRHSSFDDLVQGSPEEISGLPLVDIADLADDDRIVYADEPHELISYFEGDSLYIWFEEITVVSKYYKTGRIAFGVNALNEICCVRADSLSSFEIDMIKPTIEN